MTQWNPPPAGAIAPVGPKTSGMAIASLVFGLVSPCTFGLAGLVGLLLGALALRKVNRSGGAVTGRGLAIAGLIVSGVGLVIGIIAGALIAVPALFWVCAERPRATARNQAADEASMAFYNMDQLVAATAQYCDGHGDAFPPPDSWVAALVDGKFIESAQMVADPASPKVRMFAMNAALKGLLQADVPNPTQTVLYFECARGRPMAGGPNDLPPAPRYPAGYIIGFCDNHAEQVLKENLGNLIWNPKAVQASAGEP